MITALQSLQQELVPPALLFLALLRLCRGTETDKTMGLWSDVVTDVRAFRSSIRDMKGLGEKLSGPKYDDMMVGIWAGLLAPCDMLQRNQLARGWLHWHSAVAQQFGGHTVIPRGLVASLPAESM